ncbi:MAG: class II SORL domain-containing protein [Candidatus Aureabacteria bacterium]|nr:class II SORL domain-containing protein [Candidatus Auribacterota bacterium]
MNNIGNLFQSADWKSEKHVPVIDMPETVEKGKVFEVKVIVGKEIPHPNKTEHHISWIKLYFQPEGEKFPCQIGTAEFNAHGASVKGPDTSSVYSDYRCIFAFKTDKPGVVYASSYCNIHGLWQNSRELKIR